MRSRIKAWFVELRARTHPIVWVIVLMVAILGLVLSLPLKMQLPGMIETISIAWQMSQTSILAAIAFVLLIGMYARTSLFFADAIYLLVWILGGYHPEKADTLVGLTWKWFRKLVAQRG